MRDIFSWTALVPAAGSRRSALLWWVIWILWLPFIIPSVEAFLQTRPPLAQAVAGLTGAALFFALYIWTTWQCAQQLASALPRVQPSGAALWAPVVTMIALGVILTLTLGAEWGTLFIYASTASAGRLPLRQAAYVLAGIVVFTVAGVSLRGSFADAISPAAFEIVPGAVVIALVQSVQASQRLRAAQEEMARLAAVTEERLRIARDLHDLLGHNLSLIALKSELARRLVAVAPERAAAEIADIESVSRAALQEVREAVAGYRAPTLAGELHSAREILAAAGIDYRYEGDEVAAMAFPPAIEAVLSWTAREGVTNVIRHSRARRCIIRMARDAGSAHVEVLDDGSAAAPAHADPSAAPAGRTGNGLRGLGERVAALGGTFEAGPRPEGGFRLAVSVPLTAGAHERRDQDARRNNTAPAVAPTLPGAMEPAHGGGSAQRRDELV